MTSKLIGRFSGFEQDIAALEKQVKYALTQAGTALQDDMKVCLRSNGKRLSVPLLLHS